MIDLTIAVEIKLNGLVCFTPGAAWVLPPVIAQQIKAAMEQQLAADLAQAGVAARIWLDVVCAEMPNPLYLSLVYRLRVALSDHYRAAYANTAGLVQLGVVFAKALSDLPLFQDQVEAGVRRQIIDQVQTQLPNDLLAAMSGLWLWAREVSVRVA
jgi:hypothetical protein